eukprot:345284-Amorphochlora_amoeboformis.AAC.1
MPLPGTLRPSTCKLSVHRYRGGTGEPTPVDDYIMATGALPDCPNGGDCKDLNVPFVEGLGARQILGERKRRGVD